MSVVQITKACTLSCSYCFDVLGQNEAKSKSAKVTIDKDTFSKYLSRMGEFFKSNPKEKNICISGGEPTLHPLFKQFVNNSIHSGFEIYLLSNFTFSTDIANFLKKYIDSGKISSMVNINSPYADYAGMKSFLWTRTLMNLKILENPGIRLSFNIFDPDLDYEFIFEVLKKYPNLDTTIRLGVVNSIIKDLREEDTYVFDNNIVEGKKESMWSKYKRLGKVTDKLVERLTKLGYSIYLDCGVGWCIFNPKTIDLIKDNGGQLHGCSLPNDEVSTDGQYGSCYTLYDYGNEDKKLNVDNISIKKSRWHFILKTEFFKEHYLILPKCMRCPLLEKGCPRFCVSNNVYYYEKLFKNGYKNIVEDSYYLKLTAQEKDFTKIEYFLSTNQLEVVKELLDNNSFNELLVKGEYNSTVSIRFYMYYVLYKFLTKEFGRGEGLRYIGDIMTKVGKKEIQLVKIVEVLLKEYKFLD